MLAFLLRRSLLAATLLSNLLPFATAQTPATLPSESPATLVPTNSGFDYDRRDVMIPMRDGVKLHTVIVVPKGASSAPILLTRTPYNATQRGVLARIVMPLMTPLVKTSATRGFGADVILHGANYDEACHEAMSICDLEGLTFIHPFDDHAVINGQGTIGLELLE